MKIQRNFLDIKIKLILILLLGFFMVKSKNCLANWNVLEGNTKLGKFHILLTLY